jgi:septal ring factor EnvC (AmiA/AmiB activator)
LAAASAPVAPVAETADAALSRARSEAQQASRKLAALEGEAARAGSEAAKLQAEQAAAAASIDEAEARINESDARLRLARAHAAWPSDSWIAATLWQRCCRPGDNGRQPPILTWPTGVGR